MEMALYTSSYDTIASFRQLKNRTTPISVSEECDTVPELPETYVTLDGERIEF